MKDNRKIGVSFFLVLASTWAHLVTAETLQDYAAECDKAVAAGTPFTPAQVTVPDFNCDAGTEVPITNYTGSGIYPDGICDRPNVLNGKCDPGSRFQVLRRDPYVVAHCRKEGGEDGLYGDIAVIQWNEDNGATCFYQALGNQLHGDMAGTQVQAPSEGTGLWPSLPTPAPQPTPGSSHWLSPGGTPNLDTADIGCANCHDNGQIIRSPYLAQLSDTPNFLPGTKPNEVTTFNKDQPYNFVGEDFASWKVYEVNVAGSPCLSCHRMGVSNVGGGGTARDFGIRATAPSQAAKNPHSPTSPIWMPPGHVFFDQSTADAAKQIRDCAIRISENPLPDSPGCRLTRITGTSSSPPGVPNKNLTPIYYLIL